MSLQRFNELVRMGVPLGRADDEAKYHKGGGQSTNTVQSAEPPAYLVPSLKEIANRSKGLSQRPQSFVPQSFGADTKQSFGMARDFSNTDPTYGQAGMDSMMKTAQGGFLGANPFMEDALNSATRPVMDQVNAQFQGGGRYGSAGHAGAMAQQIGDIRSQAYMGNYERERENMMDASKFLPMGQQMMDSSAMGRIGARQGVGGMLDADRTARWDFRQNEPWNRLSRYAGLINPGAGFGGTQSSSGTMPGGSKFAGALGGGLMGGMAGSAVGGSALATGFSPLAFMGPYGALIGAGLGALGGAYM